MGSSSTNSDTFDFFKDAFLLYYFSWDRANYFLTDDFFTLTFSADLRPFGVGETTLTGDIF